MEKVYITKCLIKHNGIRYSEGSEISLDKETASRLLELDAIQPIKKTIESNNTPQTKDGDGDSPVQKSKPGSTPEANSEKQTKPPSFTEMTNTQQIEYLSSLSDVEFKTRYEELINDYKSKSKLYAEKRFKSLTEDEKE